MRPISVLVAVALVGIAALMTTPSVDAAKPSVGISTLTTYEPVGGTCEMHSRITWEGDLFVRKTGTVRMTLLRDDVAVRSVDLPIAKGTEGGTEDVDWDLGDGVTGTYKTEVVFFEIKATGKIALIQVSDEVGEVCRF